MPAFPPSASGGGGTGGGAFSAHPLCCYDTPIETHLSVGNAVTLAVRANPDRVYLAFINGSGAAQVSVSITESFTFAQGWQVPASSFPLELNRENHGPLVTQAWNVRASGAATAVTVIEVMGHCERDNRECGKHRKDILYAGRQRSLSLNPDHGFLVTQRQSPSRWTDIIQSYRKPIQSRIPRQSGRIRQGHYIPPWSEWPDLRLGIRLNSEGGDTGYLG